jgi:hypothetical protein
MTEVAPPTDEPTAAQARSLSSVPTSSVPTTTSRLRLRGAVIADSTGRVVVCDVPRRSVLLGRYENLAELSDPDGVPLANNAWTIAGVMATDRARRVCAPLFRTRHSKAQSGGGWGLEPKIDGQRVVHDPALTVISVGGTPIAAHMASGGLRYFVVPSWQTPYDAAGLIALALQADHFGFARLDVDEEMSGSQFLDTFRLHRTTKEGKARVGPGTTRCVPPVLVFAKPAAPTAGEDAVPGETVADRIVRQLRLSFRATSPLEITPTRHRFWS